LPTYYQSIDALAVARIDNSSDREVVWWLSANHGGVDEGAYSFHVWPDERAVRKPEIQHERK
jgi:hypothetical protein